MADVTVIFINFNTKEMVLRAVERARASAQRVQLEVIVVDNSTRPEEKLGHLDHWKNGWIGQKPGDKITFEVNASCIAVQYRKTIRRPALRAQLVLDGDTAHAAVLDGNFDEDWGDCLYLQPILHHGEQKNHTVEITILPTEDETPTEFYLMALITA